MSQTVLQTTFSFSTLLVSAHTSYHLRYFATKGPAIKQDATSHFTKYMEITQYLAFVLADSNR